MARPKVDPEKRQRIAHACDTCKRRKQKCDGKNPCGRCQRTSGGLVCTYGTNNERFNHTPPPKRELTGFASAPYTTRSQTPPTDFGITTPSATPSYQYSWSLIIGGNGSSPFLPNPDFFGTISETMDPRLSTQEPVATFQQASRHFRPISNSNMGLSSSHVSRQFQNGLYSPPYFANDNSPHRQDLSPFPLDNFLGVQTSTLEPRVASQGGYDDPDGVDFDSLLPSPGIPGMDVVSGNGTWGNGGLGL